MSSGPERAPRLGRRRFIGLGAAVAGGAAAGAAALALGSRARLAWTVTRGFPDRPVELVLTEAALPDGTSLDVTLRVQTPDGEHQIEAGQLVVSGDRATGTVALVYPFERRVAGTYRYHAEVRVGRGAVATTVPATYSVRRMVFFS